MLKNVQNQHSLNSIAVKKYYVYNKWLLGNIAQNVFFSDQQKKETQIVYVVQVVGE